MIAVAANSASAVANKLSFSWFDFVFVAVLAFGVFRGRRNGLSRELIPLMQWIAVVVVCGLGYPTLGQLCITYLKWGKAIADVTGYVVLMAVILFFFAFLKRLFTERLVKNDTFKGAEYYLGMPAGMLRFACMLLAALAILNAPYYSTQEVSNQKAFAKANFGGGLMSGTFFPTFPDIQDAIFVQSFSGHCLKDHLGLMMIDTHRLDVKNQKPAPKTGH